MIHERSLPLVLATTVSAIIFLILSPARAAETTPAPTTSASTKTIEEYQRKITELQGQENSLAKQIGLLDTQISVTQLRVESIKGAIGKLASEITELVGEIDRLEAVLTRRSELVLRRIPASYKRNQIPLVGALFLSKHFSEVLHEVKYIMAVEQEDAQLLFQLKATQDNFAQRKDLRESKRKQQETLQAELEKESKELETQKRQKQTILDQTRSSEAVYQKLLAQALAERRAIEQAIIEGVKVGPVKKGDPIALVGNTGYPGCSSGPHLHFEVRRNNAWVNAEDFVVRREVRDDQVGARQSIGNGSWDWPLEGDIIVSQHFGKTPYSWRYAYSGGIHTGIDMHSNSSEIIRAPHDGTLFSSSQSCGGSSVIKIKYIEHGDGVVSFYLHVK